MPKDEEEDSWLVSLEDMLLDEWGKFEYVETDDDWFIAFRIPGNVYVIEEPLHDQYVMAFLIIGDERRFCWIHARASRTSVWSWMF